MALPAWHRRAGVAWPCATVRIVAAIWDDHPDYDQDWKP